MKISILTPDFSHNCFGRAWLLVKILKRHYDVEAIGPVFGEGIWKPLADACDFNVKMVKGYANGHFELRKMLKMISGDVIYASKPLISSFGVALIKKFRTGKPVVLDIDDWELGFGKEFYDSLTWPKKIKDFLLSISNYNSYYYKIILNKFIRFANDITVSGKVLHSIYGGTIIWHGRDIETFNPQKFNESTLKKKLLSDRNENIFVISFIGTPRPHKGLEDLINAMDLLRDKGFLLMIVGMEDSDYHNNLKKKIEGLRLNENVKFFPQQPFEKLPEFLSITNLVVIPQRERLASYGQVPAKLFDAMAMAKPIIATNISDIPEILDGCGWIVEPENPKRLAETIEYIFEHPIEAEEMGRKAREKCKQKYSWAVMEESLMKIFEKYRENYA